MSVAIRLKRSDRVYKPGDTVSGFIVCTSDPGSSLSHSGIKLRVTGTVQMQLSPKNVGLFEAFYTSVKPIEVLSFAFDIAQSGKLPPGETPLPFEFELAPVKGQRLFETYHGVYVNVEYRIDCDMPRPRLSKNLHTSQEFIVEVETVAEKKSKLKSDPVKFQIDPSSLQNVGKKLQDSIATFRIHGHLDSSVCKITDCFSGAIVVERSEAEIESIDLQLTRVETCGEPDPQGNTAKEATEIQSLQIVHGDPCRGLPLPIHMIFPRLFTCPTVTVRTFKVQFEVNLIIQFCDGYQITENFPITIVR